MYVYSMHVRWHLDVEREVLGRRGRQAEECAGDVLGDGGSLEGVSAVCRDVTSIGTRNHTQIRDIQNTNTSSMRTQHRPG